MRHWGKLNFTYDGKLRLPQCVPWHPSRGVPRYMTQIHLESCTLALVYCGTKVNDSNSSSTSVLVYCGKPNSLCNGKLQQQQVVDLRAEVEEEFGYHIVISNLRV